jgi:hypothetical protein
MASTVFSTASIDFADWETGEVERLRDELDRDWSLGDERSAAVEEKGSSPGEDSREMDRVSILDGDAR